MDLQYPRSMLYPARDKLRTDVTVGPATASVVVREVTSRTVVGWTIVRVAGLVDTVVAKDVTVRKEVTNFVLLTLRSSS